jgi:isopentenyldiphosphate isomerase
VEKTGFKPRLSPSQARYDICMDITESPFRKTLLSLKIFLSASPEERANRRLQEEMGFKTELTIKTNFVYKVKFENNLIEHEFDYILIGTYNKHPVINVEEVCNYKWINLIDIKFINH